ncbi:hypothetical protein [Brevibacillus sp. SYSU BS000544]|uniref:hypothetical protein n=1 Tax=Brevibacillus sp. SYSU BS000544 TaxID=3416443 RepID=UPI003CE4545D
MRRVKWYGRVLWMMTALVLLGGCGVNSDRTPQQPPTSKTYSIYTNQQNSGFKITQMPGVIDMISGLSR